VVCTLIPNDMFEPGAHSVSWNGQDHNGRNLPSGVYLCRLTAGDKQRTRRVTLLK